MAEQQTRSVIIDPAVLAERRARRVAELQEAPPPHPAPPPPAPDASAPPPWTAPPRPPGRLVAAEHLWRERREALERELAAAGRALAILRDEERTKREAVFTALETARADLRAVRAARAADVTALATLTAELDAERIAHAVARATAARLRRDLDAARAELAARPAAPAPAPPPAGDLAARAREQAEAAAAAERRSGAGRLVADLDAAAATLRRGAVGDRHLRRALIGLAQDDPVAAGRVLVGLLPVLAEVLDEPVSFDVTIRGLGTYAVTGADARRVPHPRRRDVSLFHLRGDAVALAELLAGEPRRIGRFRGRVRAVRRKRAGVLAPLPQARLSLAEALRAGARIEPALVYAALPYAVDPEWTRGHAFTVAQEITEHSRRTWYVTARDGERLSVAETAQGEPDATVAMSRAAFDALLRGEPPHHGDMPAIRGDRAAVAALKSWTDRARGI